MAQKEHHSKTMNSPFLSIIIPVYNKSRYLNKCLGSIAKQSFTDWEVILIDDGSSDNSGSICDDWVKKDKRFRIIHKTNGGVSSARNAGLALASGRYIQFTDADDWWEQEAFSFLYKECTQHKYPDVLIFGITKVFPNGENIVVTPPTTGDFNKKQFFSSLIKGQSETGIYGGAWSKLTKRTIIEENNLIFNSKYSLMEDFDFFLDVYRCSETISIVRHCEYNYLQEAENSTTIPSFRVHYPSVMRIRIKAWQLVESICGRIQENDVWLQKELNEHYLGMFVELEHIHLLNIKTQVHEIKEMIPLQFSLRPKGSSFNSSCIAWLLNHDALFVLYVYLSLRKFLYKFI